MQIFLLPLYKSLSFATAKMKSIFTFLILITAIGSFAQGDTLKARKAKSMVNREVIVKAIVAGSRLIEKDGKSILILSLDKPYPKTPLTVVFYNKAYTALNPQYLLDGKKVIVKGTVSKYKNTSQIVISDIQNFIVLPY